MIQHAGIGDPLRERAELSIDSLIYEDGTLVGPDLADRKNQINRSILREQRFAHSLAGLTSAALKAKLAQYSGSTGGDVDERANAWHAKDLELRYNEPTLGEDHVRGVIEQMRRARWFFGSQKVKSRE